MTGNGNSSHASNLNGGPEPKPPATPPEMAFFVVNRCTFLRTLRESMDHNIEFSCPAASTQHNMELPDRTRPSRRPFRGQLQRFVRRNSFPVSTPRFRLFLDTL